MYGPGPDMYGPGPDMHGPGPDMLCTVPSCKVLVDVNWRPVFWSDPDEAREVVLKFLGKAHLVKLSDTDLEWLYGMSLEQALEDPCQVGGADGCTACDCTAGA
jgi:sugar/nucleoside kinase (ribokinase family)